MFLPADRFSAATNLRGETTELKTGLVIDELSRLLTADCVRIALTRDARRNFRIYQPKQLTGGRRVSGLCVGEFLKSRFLAEHTTLRLTGAAARSSRWTSIAEAVAQAYRAEHDESDAQRWVYDRIEKHPEAGAFVTRSDVLKAFLIDHPGAEAVRARELFAALRHEGLFLPGPSGRVVEDPALWIDGRKTRVLFGIRLRAAVVAMPTPVSQMPSAQSLFSKTA